MSTTPWWKKEISLRRRARGTAVVVTPPALPKLVDRVADVFDRAPTAPSLLQPSIWPAALPTESTHDNEFAPRPLPLPEVWPQKLDDAAGLRDPAQLEHAVEREEVVEVAVPTLGPADAAPSTVSALFDRGAGQSLELESAQPEPATPAPEPAPEPTAPQPTAPQPTALQPTAQQPTAQQPTAQQPTAQQPTAPQTPAVRPTAKKPLLKRELRMPRPKLKPPKLKRAKLTGRKSERATAPRPRQSIWERNLSLPKLRRAHSPVVVVGLRVGSTQLAAAHVSNNGSIELLQLARTPLPPGLVVSGEVREPDALAVEIKEFFKQHKLPRNHVRLGVASSRIGVRALELPAIEDPKAFANAIRFRAQELLPIPVTDAVLDHVVLGEYAGEDGAPMRRVLLAFAHRDLVSRHADACRKAGLKLVGVDLDAFALLRSLSPPRAEDTVPTEAVVAVAIGHERTVFAVSDGRVCDFVRALEWGGGALDNALARSLDISHELAHEVKHQLVLDGDVMPDGLSPVQVEAARTTVRDELRALSQEIVSSLRFYQTRAGSLAIGEILVTGGGAGLPGLPEELGRLVGVPVRTADPLVRVKVGKKVKRPADPGSFAVAIGLGIEG